MVPRALFRISGRIPSIPRRCLPSRSYASSSTSTASSTHLGRNALIATAVLGAAAASYYYSESSGSVIPKRMEVFTTKIKTSKGIVEHQHHLLTRDQCSTRLHEHESTVSFPARRPTSVTRYDTNFVASNEPIEDRHAEDVIPRAMILPSGEEGGEDIKLFSIFDGHSGTATSQLLSKTLHPMIVLSLRSLYAGHRPSLPTKRNDSASAHILAYISSLTSPITSPIASLLTPPVPITPGTLTSALESAYLTLDDQIVSSPLRLIPHVPAKPGKPSVRPIIIPMAEPALSGSCAITLVVDEEREELLVASTGDCRAVAGYWVEGQGWRCEVLTDDQMGKNPNEVKRLQDEHPQEKDTVIMRGRVMGGLEPTRAFGDARYKWTQEQHEGVNNILPSDHEGKRKPIPFAKSPPYVTAKPEVTYKSLKESKEGELKFVVMATDGLWDRISSTEAVALVGAHILNPHHDPVPASLLAAKLLPSSSESSARYPPEETAKDRSSWIFEDNNAATHLIKNSLGGSDEKKRNELLSMRYPISRWLRDDITCTVVFFGQQPSPSISSSFAAEASTSAARPQMVKAKL